MAISPIGRIRVDVTGARGLSDYQVWREQGNTGTYQDYLDYLADIVIANNPGFKGDKGDMGGNVLSADRKTDLDGATVPSGTSLVQSDSYNGNGKGVALYSSATGATSSDLARHPKAMFQAEDDRIFAHVKTIPSISDFGAVGDNSTDDYPAIWAALEWCTELGEPELIIPRGQGYCSQQFELDKAITIRGNGTGRAGANISKSILRFPEGQSAFTIHTAITSPRSGQAGITGAEGTRILGLKTILGPNNTTTKHYRMRARAEIAQCVMEFGGAGVDIAVGAGSGGETEGNSNNWSVHDSRIDTCRTHGLRVQYGDSNVGSARDLDILGCGGFGVLGIAFLSCVYNNIHTSSNGTFAGRRGGTFAGVNYAINGSFHFFVPYYGATPSQLATTPPTLANDQIWIHVYAAANPAFPVWESGNVNYMPGGPAAFDGPASALSMYSESDQGPMQVHGQAELAMGTHAAGVVGRGCYRYVQNGILGSRYGFLSRDPAISGRFGAFGDAIDAGKWAEFGDPIVFPNELAWKLISASKMGYSHGGVNHFWVNGTNDVRPDRLTLNNPLMVNFAQAANNAAARALPGIQTGDWYINSTTFALTQVQP